jgi:ribosomal RNA assembly protein
MIDMIKIPEERMKFFKNNLELKKKLENSSMTKIGIDDDVITVECEDALKIMQTILVLKAFGRGFDFEDALDMLDEENYLEIVEIKDYSGKSRQRLQTLKGRVIGTAGKTKKMIEQYAEVKVAVYGKTVCMIGKWDKVTLAKQAVEMLLSGSLHNTVYRFLQRGK